MIASIAGARQNSASARAIASRSTLLAAALTGTLCLSAQAQRAPTDSARAAADSLAARLRRAEEAIALLQQQLGEQASSGTTTHSRMQLELNGRVLMHTFFNDASVNNADDPQFARPDAPSAQPGTSLGSAIRQTTLGLVVTSRDVLGGRFVGDVDVDFFGGQQPSAGGRTFPLLRLRTARAAVRWSHGEFLVGQESPLIAGLNPVSPAAIGTPAFVTAGNLWLWLPQLRATVERGSSVRIALQGAVLANTNGDAAAPFDTDTDPAERTALPATEARLRVRWGEDALASEIGCGGHLGWIDLPAGRHTTYASACDARIAMSSVELRGEAYIGRGLRGLGGGGISQNISRVGVPLEDRGGWAQVNYDATALVKLGAGCGIDEPRPADVASGGRLRNSACSGYTIVRPAGPLFFGAEFRRISTKYTSGTFADNHVNLAMGFEF